MQCRMSNEPPKRRWANCESNSQHAEVLTLDRFHATSIFCYLATIYPIAVLPVSSESRAFAWISALIIHCFRRTLWIPIPSYCKAPSSRLIAAPKVINFILGDVPTNVNARRRLLTPRLRFNLLVGPSKPLPARWGEEGNYIARSFRLLFVWLLRSVKNMNHGFRPSKKETFTMCIHDGPVPSEVPWQHWNYYLK